jgi:very-short-patch-repair endonuclease
MSRPLHNRKELKETRKMLRHNLTPAEAVLWRAIQQGKLDGRKFRRQHSVGRYVLDFYCPGERLAIELDGAGHYTASGVEHDAERTDYLQGLKITVLRFENKRVLEQLDLVVLEIKCHFTRG